MLLESGAFVPGSFYQVLMGEKSREVKLTRLPAEGEGYEQIWFEWVRGLGKLGWKQTGKAANIRFRDPRLIRLPDRQRL